MRGGSELGIGLLFLSTSVLRPLFAFDLLLNVEDVLVFDRCLLRLHVMDLAIDFRLYARLFAFFFHRFEYFLSVSLQARQDAVSRLLALYGVCFGRLFLLHVIREMFLGRAFYRLFHAFFQDRFLVFTPLSLYRRCAARRGRNGRWGCCSFRAGLYFWISWLSIFLLRLGVQLARARWI